jgi:hypothetical protein
MTAKPLFPTHHAITLRSKPDVQMLPRPFIMLSIIPMTLLSVRPSTMALFHLPFSRPTSVTIETAEAHALSALKER